MRKLSSVAGILVLAGIANAQLQISIGLRETGAGGSTVGTIGANGGATGGIEWVNLDAQTLILDGTWQLFTFNLASATYTGFAGATANGTLEGSYGVLEHIRVRNSTGIAAPIQLWIDDVNNNITPPGGSATDNFFGTFEGYANGAEVMFQEPGFSGSTAGNVDITTDAAGVDNTTAHSGSASYKFDFRYTNLAATSWVRLTSNNTTNLPNPVVRFDQNSQISFWAKAVPEPASMTALALGAAVLLRRRRK